MPMAESTTTVRSMHVRSAYNGRSRFPTCYCAYIPPPGKQPAPYLLAAWLTALTTTTITVTYEETSSRPRSWERASADPGPTAQDLPTISRSICAVEW